MIIGKSIEQGRNAFSPLFDNFNKNAIQECVEKGFFATERKSTEALYMLKIDENSGYKG